MNQEQILEIARRYSWYRDDIPAFALNQDQLIAFAKAVIEASRDTTTIKVPTVVWDKLKDVNTVTDLIKALKAAEEE